MSDESFNKDKFQAWIDSLPRAVWKPSPGEIKEWEEEAAEAERERNEIRAELAQELLDLWLEVKKTKSPYRWFEKKLREIAESVNDE